MKKALRDYAQGQEGLEEPPVREKSELFTLLDDAIAQGMSYCQERGISLTEVLEREEVFKNLDHFKQYADTLLSQDDWRKGFNVYENTISSLYEACKPEILRRPVIRSVVVFQYLRGVIESIIEQTDIDSVSSRIGQLLDESLVVNDAEAFSRQDHSAEYQLIKKGKTWDLSKINFEKLKEDFKHTTYKNIEIADLRAFIQQKLDQMLSQNVTRTDFAQRLQQIVDAYNAGSSATENYFEDLMKFAKDLHAEDGRHIREGLTEDELELFDLLKKEKMTQEETQKVKLAAKLLLQRLIEEQPKVLVQDWYKDTQTQKLLRSEVEKVLDKNLPETYNRVLFREKCDNVFEMMLDYANNRQKWAV
ncbi:MAG TPA: type I restriction enzyme endonuclease domain-containing protein [Blastocatellia bacterium]|nr:type I restriction enzyme endonuclease domain-containing protein [Blastocatellia bacterium]